VIGAPVIREEGGAMSSENKALLRRWFDEVWVKGRVDAIDEMLARNALIHGLGPEPQGPEEFKRFHAVYTSTFPDVTIQVEDILAEGNLVAARWSGTGTHRGEGLGFAATGMPVRFSGMVFVRVENGMFAEGWNIFNELGMFQQLGIVNLPQPG